ncbi:MAG TPA: hypothetical protein VHQ20_01595, partial [Patescibacteria group bacterium]|nr:hypothetical protein [Patescibacteria group bacterium]
MHHTTRNFLLPIGIGTLLSLGAFISVLWFVDPFTSGLLPHLFFYLTLSLTLIGLFTFIGAFFRRRYSPGMFSEQLRVSFRQAVLLAGLII